MNTTENKRVYKDIPTWSPKYGLVSYLREAIELKKLTIRGLAERTNIHRGAIQYFLKGRESLTADQEYRLSKVSKYT